MAVPVRAAPACRARCPSISSAIADSASPISKRALSSLANQLELVPGRRDHLRRRRVDDGQLGRERVGRRAVGLELGDRIGAVAQRLADAHVADRASASILTGRVRRPWPTLTTLSISTSSLYADGLSSIGAEHLVAVVGVGLQQERPTPTGPRRGRRSACRPACPGTRRPGASHCAPSGAAWPSVASRRSPRTSWRPLRHAAGEQVFGSALSRRHLGGGGGRRRRQQRQHGQDDGQMPVNFERGLQPGMDFGTLPAIPGVAGGRRNRVRSRGSGRARFVRSSGPMHLPPPSRSSSRR